MRPFGSVSIGNSSCCSRITGLIAERKRTASISKRALLSAPSMMSSVTGSTSTSVGISAIRGFSDDTAIAAPLSLARDQDVEPAVDLGLVAGEDDRGRVELGHDRRPGEARARLQLCPVVDLRRHPLAAKDDLVRVDDGAAGSVARHLALRQLRLRRGAEADGAKVDDLGPRVMHPEAVELLVERVEPLLELAQAVAAHFLGRERDRDLVTLAVVAHVSGIGDAAVAGVDALVLEPLLRPGAELVEDRGHVRRVGLVEHADVRAGELVPEIRDDVPERAEQARPRRG